MPGKIPPRYLGSQCQRMSKICIGISFYLKIFLIPASLKTCHSDFSWMVSALLNTSPIHHQTWCHSSKRTPEGMNFPNQSWKNVLQLLTSFLPTPASTAAASLELSWLWENSPRHQSTTAKRSGGCWQWSSVPLCSSSWESHEWLHGRTEKTHPKTKDWSWVWLRRDSEEMEQAKRGPGCAPPWFPARSAWKSFPWTLELRTCLTLLLATRICDHRICDGLG